MKIAALKGFGRLWEAIGEFGSVLGVFISDFAPPTENNIERANTNTIPVPLHPQGVGKKQVILRRGCFAEAS